MAAPPNATQIATDSQEFIRSLAFEENDRKAYDVLVHPPDIRNAGGERSRPFAKPWTFFIEIPHNATPLLRFLRWQQVFAVSKTVSFTVYDLDNDDRFAPFFAWATHPDPHPSLSPSAPLLPPFMPLHRSPVSRLALYGLLLSWIRKSLVATKASARCA
ncbi:hypothetical protein NUW54_g14768 [Trametes sanguinea]|uniref:Uncharacterized protein n=1 Tax=Trametes sanguinea TaxID=158606 RepID=A0ACC1MAA0_9APHY|nr:hypothetical protein NUW54_g14768 [Trametes sanguinea]